MHHFTNGYRDNCEGVIYARKRCVWGMSRGTLTGKKILEQNCGIACTALKLDLSTTGFVPPFKRVEISSHKFRRAYAKPLSSFFSRRRAEIFSDLQLRDYNLHICERIVATYAIIHSLVIFKYLNINYNLII